MKKIIYYVAVSLDGYISGPDGDISLFTQEGKGVNKYLEELQDFKTVIMGRKTYEFGYQYGILPGQPAYPHMEHYIFSNSLKLENPHQQVHVEKMKLKTIDRLRATSNTDIYLCGGGEFAGWLLDHGRIATLKVKLNPIILGDGVPLFGASTSHAKLKLREQQAYDYGLQIITYDFI